jgi:hypothetical protein
MTIAMVSVARDRRIKLSLRAFGGTSPAVDDSPTSAYLRCWLAHSAARHRDLLRNIAAASRTRHMP